MDSWEVWGCRKALPQFSHQKWTQRNCAFLADGFPQLVQNLYPDLWLYFSCKDQKFTSKEHVNYEKISLSPSRSNVANKYATNGAFLGLPLISRTEATIFHRYYIGLKSWVRTFVLINGKCFITHFQYCYNKSMIAQIWNDHLLLIL
jgi:hypothetical protein